MLAVCGFIRRIERKYKIKNIPAEIKDIVHLYQMVCDKWDDKYSNKQLTMDSAAMAVEWGTDLTMTVYSDHAVSNGEFIWMLKLISLKDSPGDEDGIMFFGYPLIGIIRDDKAVLETHSDEESWDEYGCQVCRDIGFGCGPFSDISTKRDNFNCDWANDGDELHVHLDLNKGTLKFILNGKDCGIAFKNIKQEQGPYRLAITCANAKGTKIVFL